MTRRGAYGGTNGNLNFGATEAAVRFLFGTPGSVEGVNLAIDRDTAHARGFRFVEMSVNAAVDRAIAGLNGRDHDGRALTLNEARPKPQRSFGGGGLPAPEQSLVGWMQPRGGR